MQNMKLIEFLGPSDSGKTTSISKVTQMLRAHGYSVVTVKSTHTKLSYEVDSKDSVKYLESGASLSIAIGKNETILHFPRKVELIKLLDHLKYDFMIAEGETGFPMPKVLFLKDGEGLERLDDLTVAIVGKDGIDGVRKIDSFDFDALYDLTLSTAMEPLPGDNCGHCGMDCKTMLSKILKGEKTLNDCVKLSSKRAKIEFDGKNVPILPFISSMIANVNSGIIKNLKGMNRNGRVKIEFDMKD